MGTEQDAVIGSEGLILQEKAGSLSWRALHARQQGFGIKEPLRLKNTLSVIKVM